MEAHVCDNNYKILYSFYGTHNLKKTSVVEITQMRSVIIDEVFMKLKEY